MNLHNLRTMITKLVLDEEKRQAAMKRAQEALDALTPSQRHRIFVTLWNQIECEPEPEEPDSQHPY